MFGSLVLNILFLVFQSYFCDFGLSLQTPSDMQTPSDTIWKFVLFSFLMYYIYFFDGLQESLCKIVNEKSTCGHATYFLFKDRPKL
jgi:hypothetical protein